MRSAGIAATLAAAAIYFAGKGRISPVYFGDAVVEAAPIATGFATE